MIGKLLRPGDGRSSRWRNARNVAVTPSRVLRNAPRAVGSFLLARLFGYRPTQPWISYDAARRIEAILTPRMSVLEYGSGMSTMWFARRAGSIIAVEDDIGWGTFQQKQLADKQIGNAEIVLTRDNAEYVHPAAIEPAVEQGGFDFIMIDGRYRDACAAAALDMLQPGGWIYLDNSDVTQFNELDGHVENARDLLRDAALARGGSVEEFVDFAPGLLFATSGHLYRFGS